MHNNFNCRKTFTTDIKSHVPSSTISSSTVSLLPSASPLILSVDGSELLTCIQHSSLHLLHLPPLLPQMLSRVCTTAQCLHAQLVLQDKAAFYHTGHEGPISNLATSITVLWGTMMISSEQYAKWSYCSYTPVVHASSLGLSVSSGSVHPSSLACS